MDETAVRKYATPKLGLVSLSPQLRRARKHGVHVHPAGRHQQLAAFTHVAFLCDDTEVQAALPQIIIGNHHILPIYAQQNVLPRLHKNVKLWRRTSSWCNGPVLIEVLKLLAMSLSPFRERFQPVLIWDAAKPHLRPDVLRCAARLGLWVIFVPARITWLLQPADTHCFARYKAYLRKRYLEISSRAPDGRVTTEDILLTMNAAVREVFQKNKWSDSFVGNGFGLQQRHVRRKILEHLQWECVPEVPCVLPRLAQFVHIWPSRVSVPIDDLFAAFTGSTSRPAVHRLRVPDANSDDVPVPWSRRLRPRQGAPHASQTSAASSAGLPLLPPDPALSLGVPCPTVQESPARRQPAGRRRAHAIPPCRR